jgi:hypothetical protein
VLQPARWDKLGLVIQPDASLWWSRTHAMLPTPEHVEGSLWRIYQAGRNDKNQSHVGWALIDLGAAGPCDRAQRRAGADPRTAGRV